MKKLIGILLFLFLLSPLLGTIYYVDASRPNDDGDGESEGAAWKTISKVNGEVFSAGDFILFKKGETWREKLIPPSDGDGGDQITFGAYGGGAAPIINGSDLIGTWTEAGEIDGDDSTTETSDGGVDRVWALQFTTTTGGVLQSITVYIGADTATTATKCAIYNNVANEPTTPIANTYSEEKGGFTPNSWNTFDVTDGATLSATTTYWIAFFADGSGVYGLPKIASGGVRLAHDDEAYDGFPSPYTVDTAYPGRGGGGYVTLGAPDVWKATVTTEPDVVWFDKTRGNLEVSAAACTSEFDWYWDDGDDLLYAYSSAGNPDIEYTSPGIEAGARASCVRISDKSYITIENFTLTQSNLHDIYISSTGTSANCIIQDNAITKPWKRGIFINTQDDNTVCNNTITGETTWGCTAGVHFYQSANCHAYGNTVSYFVIGLTFEGDGSSGDVDGGSFYGNTIFKIDNADHSGSDCQGIELVGGGAEWVKNIDVYQNIVYDCGGGGIAIYRANTNNIYYNIVYNCGKLKVAEEGGLNAWVDCDANKFYNNIVYDCQEGIQLSIDVTDTVVKNNIFSDSVDYGIHEGTEPVTGTDNDYNCVYNSGISNFHDIVKGANSIEVDPKMIDPASEDFRLLMASPCIDAGTDVGLLVDYLGILIRHAPDMGAYENQTNALFMARLFEYLKEKKDGK